MKLQPIQSSIVVRNLEIFGVYEEIQMGKGCSGEAALMFEKMLKNPSLSAKTRQYAEEMLALHQAHLGDLKLM